jgi:hypothetical protein
MANVTPFTLIVIVAILTFITPYLAGMSQEYGTATATNNLTGLAANLSVTYTNRVLVPLVGNPYTGGGKLNTSSALISGMNNTATSNMGSASTLFGFAFAFILPGMINILLQMLYIPSIIGQAVGTLVGFLPISPLSSATISSQVTGLGWLFIGLLFFSSYLKYPLI